MFVRRYWYSDSVKDIAARMQISESKVKTTLFRVRNELQDFLLARGVVV
jgi:RNA polymerase sigma-70 factor (ECF subfamily)